MKSNFIEGNILWSSDKNKNGIIVDADMSEYYFDISTIMTYPELVKRNAFVLFSPSRLKECKTLVAKDVSIIPEELESTYDEFINSEYLLLSDFISDIHVSYLKNTFQNKRLNGIVSSVKQSVYKDDHYDIDIIIKDAKFPRYYKTKNEMLKSRYKFKKNQAVSFQLYITANGDLLNDHVRPIK